MTTYQPRTLAFCTQYGIDSATPCPDCGAPIASHTIPDSVPFDQAAEMFADAIEANHIAEKLAASDDAKPADQMGAFAEAVSEAMEAFTPAFDWAGRILDLLIADDDGATDVDRASIRVPAGTFEPNRVYTMDEVVGVLTGLLPGSDGADGEARPQFPAPASPGLERLGVAVEQIAYDADPPYPSDDTEAAYAMAREFLAYLEGEGRTITTRAQLDRLGLWAAFGGAVADRILRGKKIGRQWAEDAMPNCAPPDAGDRRGVHDPVPVASAIDSAFRVQNIPTRSDRSTN